MNTKEDPELEEGIVEMQARISIFRQMISEIMIAAGEQ